MALFQSKEEMPWAGRSFDALSEKLRNQFLETHISVVIIESESDNEIRDLFIRLQGGLPLSAQEKRDAWPGDFTKFIIETAGKKTASNNWTGHDFFSKLLKGTEKRGGMRKVCAGMFMQSYSRKKGGYSPESFTSTNAVEVDNFYQYHIDFNSLSEESHAPRFREILDETTSLLVDGRSPKLEAHLAYNVILILDILMGNFSTDWRHKFVDAFQKFREKVLCARKIKDPRDEYWYLYGVITSGGSADKSQVELRYRFFEREMLKFMSPLSRLDSQRGFSVGERELVYYRDKKICYKCKEEVLWADAEIDHVTPYALGGETTLDNALLVHNTCHVRGVNALKEFNKGEDVEFLQEKPWEEDIESNRVLSKTGKRVTFANLSDAGLIIDGCRVVYAHKDDSVEAEFLSPDTFIYGKNGETKKCHSFSKLVGDQMGTRSIWTKTKVEFPDGRIALLRDLRDLYISSMSSFLEDEDAEDGGE